MTLSRLQQFSSMIKHYEQLEQQKQKNGIESDVQFAVREEILTDREQKPEIVIQVYENGKLGEWTIFVSTSRHFKGHPKRVYVLVFCSDFNQRIDFLKVLESKTVERFRFRIKRSIPKAPFTYTKSYLKWSV